MIGIGSMAVKIAGRDAGLKCVIVEVLDDKFVTIDGETRRRKCNINHLEPLKETIKIKDGASHADVVRAFKELGIEIKEKRSKQTPERPKKVRKKKEEPAEEPQAKEKKPKKEKGLIKKVKEDVGSVVQQKGELVK